MIALDMATCFFFLYMGEEKRLVFSVRGDSSVSWEAAAKGWDVQCTPGVAQLESGV